MGLFVLGVGLSTLLSVGLESTHWFPEDFPVGSIGAGLFAGLFGGPLGLLIARRRLGDRLSAALRESGGKWRHGRLTVTPGLIVFEPYRRQTTLVRGTREEYRVGRVGDDTGRRPPRRQLLWINPQLHIVDLDTDRGRREIALLPTALTTLRERLSEPSLAGDASSSPSGP
ncbi:hypothetical protein [Frondihabitans sp. 762G35]|uniref:hypothetical protein n=1 Tax=Frondihabitans sp. 762G35 TaxID=1446794 RepID=UPI001C1FA41E|nr:hypothetical protein [Frondihabitans sp. 762G35]